MKSKIQGLLVILLVLAMTLSACGGDSTPAGIVKKQLTSGPWYADLSEGTAACYSFTSDNQFTCDASVTAGENSVGFSREGTYAIMEENGEITVILQYPDVNYQVKITCTPEADRYAFSIAGCAMYQK